MRYIVFAAVLLAASAPAGEISFDFSLPRGVRLVTEYAGGALPECPGGLTWFDEGQPNLPVVTHTFVIPQGMSVTGAEMEIVTEAVIDGFHNVLPVRVTSRSFLKSGPNSDLESMADFNHCSHPRTGLRLVQQVVALLPLTPIPSGQGCADMPDS